VTQRTRKYVWMVVAAIAGLVYARISRDWSFGTFYAGFAGVVIVVVLVGGFWVELAPDGDLRRKPQT
jgi:drug/metabolite transporter superfamily protein YnfA